MTDSRRGWLTAIDDLTAQVAQLKDQIAQLKDMLADESLGGRDVGSERDFWKGVEEANARAEQKAKLKDQPPDYKDVDISRAYMKGYVQAVADVRVSERFLEAAKALAEKKERGSG